MFLSLRTVIRHQNTRFKVDINIDVPKFVRSHKFFNKRLPTCRCTEVYIFYIFYIFRIYLLVIYFFSLPKIVEIVLTGCYLFEYPVAWSILGFR
jgi:hypothetical protein